MHNFADLLKSSGERWADAPCLSDKDRTLSFQQVATMTDRLAQVLANSITSDKSARQPIGFAPLPVVTSGGIDLYLLFLASIKAGRTFLPISSALSATNILGILDALGLAHQIYVAPNIHIDGVVTVPLDELIELAQDCDDTKPLFPLPDNFAVTYQTTSGSTGTPKIIPVSGANLLFQNELSLNLSTFHPNRTAGICGDWVPRQFLAAFSQGSCNSFCNVATASRSEILNWMREKRINYLTTYANTLKIFGQLDEVFEDVECVLTGGDFLTPAHVAAFENFTPPTAKLINLYASQETGAISGHTHHHGDAVKTGAWPVGQSLLPDRIGVVDGAGKAVPDETVGDIILRFGGNMVIETGYIGGAKKLKKLPDGSYYTGDRGYRDAQGVFYVVGRSDDMVKINSYAIPLGEIEQAMRGISGVADAAVKAVELNATTKILVAYYEGSAAKTMVMSALSQRLPAFMRPHYVIWIDHFPRGATGKLLKRKLLFEQPKTTGYKSQPASSVMAQNLRDLWAVLLTHDEFDENSAFFEVGGDSLTAIQLALEIERLYGNRIGISEFLEEGASIAGLIRMLTKAGNVSNNTMEIQKAAMAPVPVTSADLLQKNAEILGCWRNAPALPGASQIISESDQQTGPVVFWIVQTQGEYYALSRSLVGMTVYAGRSFANLARQLDPSEALQDADLYSASLLNPAAQELARELSQLLMGRPFILGANCQAVHFVEAMIKTVPRFAERIAAAVFLNAPKPFDCAGVPVSLLYGTEELAMFNRNHGDPKCAFAAQSLEVLDGAHGSYFRGDALDRIQATIRQAAKE